MLCGIGAVARPKQPCRGKVFDQLALPVTDRGAWALTADGRRVSVADPATGRVTSWPLGDRSLQLAAHGDRVVATSAAGGSVTVLDAATGQQTGRVSLPGARLVAIAGQDIWVDARDGLTRIGPDLAAGVADRELGTGANGDLVRDRGRDLAADVHRHDHEGRPVTPSSA